MWNCEPLKTCNVVWEYMLGVKSQQQSKLNVLEIKMLRWMSGHTKHDKIRNKIIIGKVGLALNEEKTVESHLRGVGYMWRKRCRNICETFW